MQLLGILFLSDTLVFQHDLVSRRTIKRIKNTWRKTKLAFRIASSAPSKKILQFCTKRYAICKYRIKFKMLEVCKNEIALRKLSGGTAQLRTLEATLIASTQHMIGTVTGVLERIGHNS